MSSQQFISIMSLPDSLLEETFEIVNSFSTPLLKLNPRGQTSNNPLIGSGTLITIGRQRGMLTAQHVAHELNGDFELGLPITKIENRFTIPGDRLDILEIATPATPSEGPDLAFIGLSAVDASTIGAVKCFYDLDVDKEKILNDPLSLENGLWVASGTLGIGTLQGASEIGSGKCLAFNSYGGYAPAARECSIGKYDYIELPVTYTSAPNVPNTSGGMSSGGL
jgi:hypothetical protein